MDHLRKLFRSASYGKILTEPVPEPQNGADIRVRLVGLSRGLFIGASRWDGDMWVSTGSMELELPTTPLKIVAELEDGTFTVLWNHGKES